jgi:hypothetical protein
VGAAGIVLPRADHGGFSQMASPTASCAFFRRRLIFWQAALWRAFVGDCPILVVSSF